MREFNLEEAKNGAKVVTRDNRPVRILTFNRKTIYPIVALIYNSKTGMEDVYAYTNEGKRIASSEKSIDTLFMAPVEHTVYTYALMADEGIIFDNVSSTASKKIAEEAANQMNCAYPDNKYVPVEIKYTI